jgi:hypothetical protein
VLRVLIASLLALVPAARFTAAKDAWIENSCSNFTVISNASEKEARKIADRFEQIREAFQSAFPKLRTEIGKPVVIFAVKDEEFLELLLPEYWEAKGHTHPAGVYLPGEPGISWPWAPIYKGIIRTKLSITNTPYTRPVELPRSPRLARRGHRRVPRQHRKSRE